MESVSLSKHPPLIQYHSDPTDKLVPQRVTLGTAIVQGWCVGRLHQQRNNLTKNFSFQNDGRLGLPPNSLKDRRCYRSNAKKKFIYGANVRLVPKKNYFLIEH